MATAVKRQSRDIKIYIELQAIEALFYCNEIMPYKPKVYCHYPGCNQLVDSGYCDKHKQQQPISEYDTARHIKDNKVYGNTTWRRLRRLKLNNDPLCEICLSKGIVVQATQVDHIIPVSQQPELKLVYENLQSLCETCHSKKTREENKKN